MKQVFDYIKRRLSLRLGFLIIFVVTLVFSFVFNLMFYYSKEYVRQAAIDRAHQLLDNTAVRITGVLEETELVTNYMAVITPKQLHPDSLLIYTRRTLESYSFLTGFAISMEPYYFPEMGRYYSAYSLRQGDSITTVREGPFEYFEKPWYKNSKTKGSPCWVDAYDDYNEGTLSSPDILTSYCCPMRDADGHFVGSITASLTLKWLSEAFATVHPYPNSSAIIIGSTGTYLVHPDTAKLYHETIFSDADPKVEDDIRELGKTMISGRSGMKRTIVDGQSAYIFYRPLERTGWSLALVCPESDVFSRYNHLLTLVWTFTGVGLLVLLLFLYQTIRKAVQPIKQLAVQTRHIADGNFDEPLPVSLRRDSVGRLQNSFIRMEQSLSKSVSDILQVNSVLEQRNKQLARAYQLKLEADERKSAFVLDMAHQIRTPLNIICGFVQVLALGFQEYTDEELDDIFSRMRSSSITIHRISKMLAASSTTNVDKKPMLSFVTFSCQSVCREVISSVMMENPESIGVEFVNDLLDDMLICSDRRSLMLVLSELLSNACRFTRKGFIRLGLNKVDEYVCFTVWDTGIGIPEDKRADMFSQFMKVDSFTEGIGLGLSFCKYTVELLGGTLQYDATYTSGSRFIVTIPKQPDNNI